MAKLVDMWRAALYSPCLQGWLNMRVTSEQHVSRAICMSQRQEMFLLFPSNFCVSLATNLSRATKFPIRLSWETGRGYQCRARHVSKLSQALPVQPRYYVYKGKYSSIFRRCSYDRGSVEGRSTVLTT